MGLAAFRPDWGVHGCLQTLLPGEAMHIHPHLASTVGKLDPDSAPNWPRYNVLLISQKYFHEFLFHLRNISPYFWVPKGYQIVPGFGPDLQFGTSLATGSLAGCFEWLMNGKFWSPFSIPGNPTKDADSASTCE
jgi:hypothetical protein